MNLFKKKKIDETESLHKTIREQKARIEELKRENSDLLFSLDEYTKKENSILESISYIEEKKREHTNAINAKYAAELERLKFFETKWHNLVKNSPDPLLQSGIIATREIFKKCHAEILFMTRQELKITPKRTAPEEDFIMETERLRAQKNHPAFTDTPLDVMPVKKTDEVTEILLKHFKDTPSAPPTPLKLPDQNFETVHPKKMTDDEIVSLLEQLSV